MQNYQKALAEVLGSEFFAGSVEPDEAVTPESITAEICHLGMALSASLRRIGQHAGDPAYALNFHEDIEAFAAEFEVLRGLSAARAKLRNAQGQDSEECTEALLSRLRSA